MAKPPRQTSPEELFTEVVSGERGPLSSSSLRLLTSGLTALRKTHETPLNDIELQSIYSMIAYVAYTQGVCENTVASILTAKFGGEDVKTLPSRHYQQMIEYLVDLEMDKVLN